MSTTKSLTTALVVAAAVTAPVASARPATDPVKVRPNPAQLVQAPVADNGFDWGDAGIGAGGVIALTLLSLGGFAGARRATRHTMSPAG